MTVFLFSVRRLAPRGLLLVVLAQPLAARAGEAPPAPRSAAQRAPAAAPTGEANAAAQARFEVGVAAYEDGRYREAVERFKEADQLAPSPLLSFNIAKVYERMADNRNALAFYRDYLRRLPEAENRAMVLDRIADLEKALRATGVQQLTVISSPPGATVSIDNVSRGVTPWTGELIPGPHTLALRLPGHREVVSEIELPAEHATDIELPLIPEAPPPPAVRVVPTPTGGVSRPAEPAPLAAVAAPPEQELGAVPAWWTWALFGGSAVAFVGAGAFEIMRGNLEDDARQEQIQIEHERKFGEMENRQTTARVFLGAGILAAIAGGVSLYFDLEAADVSPDDVALGCGSAGCMLEAKGRF